MPSSIQEIEAALARVQLPRPRQTASLGAFGRGFRHSQRGALGSCSFNIEGCDPASDSGLTSIAAVQPPHFCKPLRKVVSAPAAMPVSMLVKPLQVPPPAAEVKTPIPVPLEVTESGAPVPSGGDIQPLAIRPIQEGPAPNLPRSKPPEFSSHRNSANPVLSLGLLQDIAKEVMTWQWKLQEVHNAIQALYDEGPIINGWLESGDGTVQLTETSVPSALGQHYRLCGLDKSGQVWRKLCPPEQLPQVSLAIARYQKLRQLLSQKKLLDMRLQRLAQTLTMLRGHLRAY